MSIWAGIQVSSDLCHVLRILMFFLFFSLKICPVYMYCKCSHPSLVKEINKRCETAFILVLPRADYCNPENPLLFFCSRSTLPLLWSSLLHSDTNNNNTSYSRVPTSSPVLQTIRKILELPTKTYVGLFQNLSHFYILCIPHMQARMQLLFSETSWQADLVHLPQCSPATAQLQPISQNHTYLPGNPLTSTMKSQYTCCKGTFLLN